MSTNKTANSKTVNNKTNNSKTVNSNSKTVEVKKVRVACDITAIETALKSTQMQYELKERSGKKDCFVARLYIDKKPQVLLEIGKYSVRTYIHSTCALFDSVKAYFKDSAELTGTYDRSATLTLDDISTFRAPEKSVKSDEAVDNKKSNNKTADSKNKKNSKKSA